MAEAFQGLSFRFTWVMSSQSLQAKLAIEPERGYSSIMATTYRVFSFADILRRRDAAGLTHVIRSKGAQFVDPITGIPVQGTPSTPEKGTPDSLTGIPKSGEMGIPVPGTQLRTKKKPGTEESLAATVGVVSTALRKHLVIDDDAVCQIVKTCLQHDSSATPEEIAYFAELKVHQHRKNPSIQNLPGLLICAVQDYFHPGSGELAEFRAAKARQQAQGREVAQQILDDPQSSEKDRVWA